MPQSTFLYAVPSVLNISFPLQSDVGTLTHLHGPVQKSPSSKAFHYGPRVHHFLLQISTAFHVLTLESLGLSLRITHSRSIPWHCVADAQSLACTWMKVKVKVTQLCPTLCDPMDYTVHGILQARILEWVAFLQGIFPTQGSNPDLLRCKQILYQLSHKGSPRILKWVAYLFSSRSSWPRNWARVSCIAGGFFTNWAVREAHGFRSCILK